MSKLTKKQLEEFKKASENKWNKVFSITFEVALGFETLKKTHKSCFIETKNEFLNKLSKEIDSHYSQLKLKDYWEFTKKKLAKENK